MPIARTGTKKAPNCIPDIAVAMASDLFRMNQLLTTDIMASHPPSPEPKVMIMKVA